METWRPSPLIRVKSLGLHWRDGNLLATKIYNDAGELTGVRPLGGTIEFSETADQAAVREFNEELGIHVEIKGAPIVMENLFSHEGQLGHEIVFIFQVTFPKNAFLGQDEIVFWEDSGTPCRAAWFDLTELDKQNGPKLYPSGLKKILQTSNLCQ